MTLARNVYARTILRIQVSDSSNSTSYRTFVIASGGLMYLPFCYGNSVSYIRYETSNKSFTFLECGKSGVYIHSIYGFEVPL